MESRERARSAVRKEKLNRKRWQSEPRVQKEAQPAPAAPESKQQKLEKDVQKNEIRLTLPQTMALEKLANMKSPSVPVSSKVNFVKKSRVGESYFPHNSITGEQTPQRTS